MNKEKIEETAIKIVELIVKEKLSYKVALDALVIAKFYLESTTYPVFDLNCSDISQNV
ncbi:MAG: hypothetical protein RSD67_05525 [Oscillospiraceae bacterium]